MTRLTLDGESLSIAELARAARDPRIQVGCAQASLQRVELAEKQVNSIVEDYTSEWKASADKRATDPDYRPKTLDYGVTTGFGEFKNKAIHPEKLKQLQNNILLSHAAGVGDNVDPDDLSNYFPPDVVRAALVIRLNAFLRGHSGVRGELVNVLERMINSGVVPLVPLHGSVGSSGDLSPLSHTFVVLLGQGRYGLVQNPNDLSGEGWRATEKKHAEQLMADLGFRDGSSTFPVSFKEGLALTNGAAFSTAMLALATRDAESLAGASDVALALSLEAVCGCVRAFDPKVHNARPHRGQIDSAANLRSLLLHSKLIERQADRVQDSYSLRCGPVVHGATRDAIAYAKMVLSTEINSATDNPLFFPSEEAAEPWDYQFSENWPQQTRDGEPAEGGYDGTRRHSYSAGNFHGQPIGLAADLLTIGLAELANISERRTQMLLDEHHSGGLPPNLIPDPGIHSGFMIAQYCAAGLVSENKVLAHPASVDSIPTSANTEDHVAMATGAARKLRRVLANVQAVLAIELLVAVQAVEWRVVHTEAVWEGALKTKFAELRAEFAKELSDGLERETRAERKDALDRKLRKKLNKELKDVRFLALTDPDNGNELIGWTAKVLGEGTRHAYVAIRLAAGAMREDETLDQKILGVRILLENDGRPGADPSTTLFTRVSQTVDLRPIPHLQTVADSDSP